MTRQTPRPSGAQRAAVFSFLRLAGLTAAAALFLAGTLYVFGMGFRPDLTGVRFSHDEARLDAIEEDRDVSFDPDDPVVLHRAVDFALGSDAPWYPKGESPFLSRDEVEARIPQQGQIPAGPFLGPRPR